MRNDGDLAGFTKEVAQNYHCLFYATGLPLLPSLITIHPHQPTPKRVSTLLTTNLKSSPIKQQITTLINQFLTQTDSNQRTFSENLNDGLVSTDRHQAKIGKIDLVKEYQKRSRLQPNVVESNISFKEKGKDMTNHQKCQVAVRQEKKRAVAVRQEKKKAVGRVIEIQRDSPARRHYRIDHPVRQIVISLPKEQTGDPSVGSQVLIHQVSIYVKDILQKRMKMLK